MSRGKLDALKHRTKDEILAYVREQMAKNREALLKKDESHQNELKKYKKEISELKNKVTALESTMAESLTEDHIIKMILKEKACGKSVSVIYKILNMERGIDVSKDRIKVICRDISSLAPHLVNYFNDCQSEYVETIKINDDHLRKTNIANQQSLYDFIEEKLHNEEDPELQIKWVNQLKGISKNIIDLTKGIGGNEDTKESVNPMVDFSNEKKAVILNLGNIQITTMEEPDEDLKEAEVVDENE